MQLLLNLGVSLWVESENVLSSIRDHWFVLDRKKLCETCRLLGTLAIFFTVQHLILLAVCTPLSTWGSPQLYVV